MLIGTCISRLTMKPFCSWSPTLNSWKAMSSMVYRLTLARLSLNPLRCTGSEWRTAHWHLADFSITYYPTSHGAVSEYVASQTHARTHLRCLSKKIASQVAGMRTDTGVSSRPTLTRSGSVGISNSIFKPCRMGWHAAIARPHSNSTLNENYINTI